MRYKSHRYKIDLKSIFSVAELQDEHVIGKILGWLYENIPSSKFRYNHTEKVIRFQSKEDRMGFKLRWI